MLTDEVALLFLLLKIKEELYYEIKGHRINRTGH